MLGEAELDGVPLLVFANKQDLPNAMSAGEVEERLGLLGRPFPTRVQGACAITGDGLHEGLDWLLDKHRWYVGDERRRLCSVQPRSALRPHGADRLEAVRVAVVTATGLPQDLVSVCVSFMSTSNAIECNKGLINVGADRPS